MLSKEHRIYTANGYYKLSDIYNDNEIKSKANKLYSAKGWHTLNSIKKITNVPTVKLFFDSGHIIETTSDQKIITISKQLVPVEIEVDKLKIGNCISLFAPEIIHPDLIYIQDIFNMFNTIVDFDILNESINYRLNYFLGAFYRSVIENKSPYIKCINQKESDLILTIATSLMAGVSRIGLDIYIHNNSLIPFFIMIQKLTGLNIPVNNLYPVFNFTSDQYSYLDSILSLYQINLNKSINLFDINKKVKPFNEKISKLITNLCAWSTSILINKQESSNTCFQLNSDLKNFYSNGFLFA